MNLPLMILHNSMADRQTQTCPFDFWLRRIERLKDQIHLFRINTYASVLDRNGDLMLIMTRADRDLLPAIRSARFRRIVQ